MALQALHQDNSVSKDLLMRLAAEVGELRSAYSLQQQHIRSLQLEVNDLSALNKNKQAEIERLNLEIAEKESTNIQLLLTLRAVTEASEKT